MNKSEKRNTVLLILLTILIVWLIQKDQPSFQVSLDYCIDGDTAQLFKDGKSIRVRFAGIDTPEINYENSSLNEAFAIEAKDYTCTRLSQAKEIRLEVDLQQEFDQYGRSLMWVYVDEQLLQNELVKNGYARVTIREVTSESAMELYRLQTGAQDQKLGIWNK